MARIKTAVEGRSSHSIGDRYDSTADRANGAQQPMLRLKGVRPMTTAEQQRFDMLFDALIAHWIARSGFKGEKSQ